MSVDAGLNLLCFIPLWRAPRAVLQRRTRIL